MNYHMAEKHASSSSKQSTVCLPCEKEFPSYYLLQQHQGTDHGAKQRSKICIAQKHSNGVSGLCLIRTYTKKSFLYCLLSNKDKQPYKDCSCLFRALAINMNGHKEFDSLNCRYSTEFSPKSGHDPKNFRGIYIE